MLAEEAVSGEPFPQVLSIENIAGLTRLVQIGKGEPHGIHWSPDGETVALTTGMGVHLFDGRQLEPLGVLASGYSTHLSFSADSSLLVLCSDVGKNQSIQLWDYNEQRLVREIKQDRTISALHIDQEKGEILALGQKSSGTDKYGVPLYKGYLDIYALKTGKKKTSASFQSSDKQLMQLSLCPGGRTIFMTGISEYSFLDFKGKQLYKGSLSFAMGATGVANTSTAAFLNYTQPGTIRLIDLKTDQETAQIKLNVWPSDMALDDKGETLLLYTSEGWQAYTLATGELITQVLFKEYAAMSPRISPGHDRLAALDGDRLLLVDLTSNALLGSQEGFLPRAWQAAVSGNTLAASKRTANDDETAIHLWELSEGDGAAQGVIPQAGTQMPNLIFSPDGSRLASLHRNSDAVKFFSIPGGAADGEMRFEDTLYSACLSADFRTLMASFGNVVEVWPIGGDVPLMKAHMNWSLGRVSLSADGSRASASDGETASVWDVKGQERLLDVRSSDLAFGILSPDGATLAVALHSKKGYSIKLFDISKRKVLWTYTMGENLQELCFSPDGSLLAASGYEDGLVFINPKNGKRVYVLNYNIADFSFSPDGRLIASTSSDGTLGVWSVP
jgi:WD40 repeat protein